MSDSKVLIEPLVLDPADFPPLPLDPGFQQLVSDELQDTATPSDGFDDIVGEAIGILDGLDTGLSALNPTLADTFAEADLIDAGPVGDTNDGFVASLDAPSTSVDDLGTLLAGASPPTPPGGGGGAGTTEACVVTFNFSPGASPQTLCITVQVQ